jgi:hypothetical protein
MLKGKIVKNEMLNADPGNKFVSCNPFIEGIKEHIYAENFTKLLASSPLTGIDVNTLQEHERLQMLDRIQEEYFEPTSTALEITKRLFRLIGKGYVNRNPTQSNVRKMTMELAGHSGKELEQLPWNATYAKGMTITGVTGVGKTFYAKRALQLLPQCIEHGRSQAAGWASMKQVIWLYVAMSHDGSLGGLLLQILCALDEVIGTNYSQQKALTNRSNEKLAVLIGIILRNHGVGVLVIDEIQSRNFYGYGRGGLAATFFLRLLNFGIPVLLMGNPLGMSALYSFSQDVRRIGSAGSITIHPLMPNDFDWKNCIAPGILGQNVMPEPPKDCNLQELLFQFSGGISDFACRIHVASQRLALDLGQQCITPTIMKQAYSGYDFSDKERDIIEGFRDKNPIKLIQYDDIPWEEYANRWGLRFDGQSINKVSQLANDSANYSGQKVNEVQQNDNKLIPVPQKLLQQIKQRQTRKANADRKQKNVRQNLDNGDMRVNGLQEVLVSGFESILP